jgi:hypothetical protein
MRVRDRRPLAVMAGLAVVLAVVHGATGVGSDALIAVPGLLLLLPLAAGRYVGAERLVRLARRAPASRVRRDRPVARLRPARRVVPCGGLLIAVALGRRGPPAGAAAR